MNERDHIDAPPVAREAAERALQQTREELASVKRELAQVREEAAAAAVQREEFLAALSHELRTPLNPVLLIASEAAENLALPESVRRDFATIAKNAELEARLINDLLDLDRFTRGKISLDKRSLDVRSALRDAIANVQARLDAKEIELITTLDARPHRAFGDAARLQQIFWTLLKQSVKLTPAGGKIELESRVDEVGRRIEVVFASPGNGSAAPFALDGGSASPSPRGGLSMILARQLVEVHGGTIETSLPGPEQGATFTVRLPLAADSGAGSGLPLSPSSSATGPANTAKIRARVLLVEDHEPTRVTLARLLTRRNFAVTPAGSVEAALQAAAGNEFDFVICDIALPDGDGYSLMTELTERHGLLGIAVTGFGMPTDLERSEAAGFIAHITKPVSVQALEAAFKNAQSAGVIKLSHHGE